MLKACFRVIVAAGAALATAGVITVTSVAGQGPSRVPKTPWGEPDLQGIYNGNDLQGVPMQRAESVGTRERAQRRRVQAARGAAATRCWRNDNSDEFDARSRPRSSRALRRRRRRRSRRRRTGSSARKTSAASRRSSSTRPTAACPADARGADSAQQERSRRRRRAPQAAQGHRGRLDHRSQQLRPLHQPRHRWLGDAEDLQLRQPYRAGPGLAGVQQRDDSRDARHPDRRPQERRAPAIKLVDGQLGRALGGRHARRRDAEPEPEVGRQRAAALARGRHHRALHAAPTPTRSTTG